MDKEIRPATKRRILEAFATRDLRYETIDGVQEINDLLHMASLRIAVLAPEGRHLNTALKKLEEAAFWAHSALWLENPIAPDTEPD